MSLWSTTGSMSAAVRTPMLVKLQNGNILRAGGDGSGVAIAGCDLYNPSTGYWTATAPMSIPRNIFGLILLYSGKVLAIGGETTGSTIVASCELYDPSTNLWTPTGPMATARAYVHAVLLADHTVLVAGGAPATTACEIYDPAGAGTWSPTGSLNVLHNAAYNGADYGGLIGPLSNGKILLGGNANSASQCELYDPSAGTWAFTTTNPVFYGSVFLGYDNPQTNIFVLLNTGKVLLAGFTTATTDTVATFIYDPSSDTWSATGSQHSLHSGSCGIVLQYDGTVLIIGGSNPNLSPSITDICEIYDPVANTWTLTDSLSLGKREGGAAILLNDGNTLVTGGRLTTSYIYTATSELYNGPPPPPPPPLTLSLSDSVTITDSVNETDSILLSVSDSVTVTDSITAQSDHVATVNIPIVEQLVNQLVPAFVKTYFKIVE